MKQALGLVTLGIALAACSSGAGTPSPIPGTNEALGRGGETAIPTNSADFSSTQQPAGDADVAREDTGTFSIDLSGSIETSLATDAGADYTAVYEEPSGSPQITAEAQGNQGMHTVSFNAPDGSYAVVVTFSDQLAPGTYGVGVDNTDIGNPEMTIGVLVETGDISYNILNGGQFTLDALDDGLLSGTFTFELAASNDANNEINVIGTFDNLLLDKDVAPLEGGRTS